MNDLWDSDSIPEFDLSLSDIVPAVATGTPSTMLLQWEYDIKDVLIAPLEVPCYRVMRCAMCSGIALPDLLSGYDCPVCGIDVETVALTDDPD